MCTHCLLLYILRTTDIITLRALPSLFSFTILQFKAFIVFFSLFQSLKVKNVVGTEILGIRCSFLCYTKSQEVRPTWSGGERV